MSMSRNEDWELYNLERVLSITKKYEIQIAKDIFMHNVINA